MSAKELTVEEGVALLVERGYEEELIRGRFELWLGRGDVALIFQNNDMGHPELGHVFTMPWAAEDPLPPHGPDNPSTGLGWRYTTDFVVRPERKLDPRNNADDAFTVFMAMGDSEWSGLIGSLLRGGVLQPQEQVGFERAIAARKEKGK